MRDPEPIKNLDIETSVAFVLLVLAGWMVYNARKDLNRARRLMIDERRLRRDAEESAETRRNQLDGALEQLHEASAAREKAERDLSKARKPARTTRPRTSS